MLFEPPRREAGRRVFITLLDVILLVLLGLGFLLLDIVFRSILKPEDLESLRAFMIATWMAVFITQLILAYLRERE